MLFPVRGGGTATAHLRNGYTPHYALLFNSINNYINDLRQSMGINLPIESLQGRLNFHRLLVRFVAGALVAAGEHPGVNDNLSSISFTLGGLASDDRFPIIDWKNNIQSPLISTAQIWL